MTILSHRHRLIFVAIPKVASHSIRFALRPHLGGDDEEQVSLFVRKRIARPVFDAQEHGHQLAREVRAALGPELWGQYFSFAVIRNPWDRFVSYVAFMMRHNGLFERDPQAAMRRVLAHPQNQSAVHYRPQSDFVTDEGGQVIVSALCRVERLQADFAEVCARIGLPPLALEQRNPSVHRPYTEYYDEELRDAVAALYREDIERFGYRFGTSG
jgi:hypothetical protein